MACRFAAIADDFTGGSDLASMLAEGGASVVLLFGIPGEPLAVAAVDAYVLCLKSRSIPAAEARRMSRQAAEFLLALEPAQLQFKYCSTFDSTAKGNIGPVTEELLDRLDLRYTIAAPALPVNGRTQYLGHLFVNGRLLSESPMRDHPLNPMLDPDLVRHLQMQTRLPVGLIPLTVVRQGAEAVREAMARQQAAGVAISLVDAIEDSDLAVIAEASLDLRLITGGSGLGRPLPRLWGLKPMALEARESVPRRTLIVSGSCSAATLEQLDQLRASGVPVRSLEERHRLSADLDARNVAAFSSSAAAGQRLSIAGEEIEQRLAEVARIGVREWGVQQLIVAGGETSGAVVQALELRGARLAGSIAPGVPALVALKDKPYALALKSGNFGGPDFFLRAQDHLNRLAL
jgi:uncharacterized protein YgbK (DUF1537 family)